MRELHEKLGFDKYKPNVISYPISLHITLLRILLHPQPPLQSGIGLYEYVLARIKDDSTNLSLESLNDREPDNVLKKCLMNIERNFFSLVGITKNLPKDLLLKDREDNMVEIKISPEIWHSISQYLKFSDIKQNWISKVLNYDTDVVKEKGC